MEQNDEETILVSNKTPLLSNLDMKENIALIKEVHHKKPRLKAEDEAKEMLQKIGLERIADFRSNRCTKEELFYVMIIRAFMCDRERIVIKSPLQLLENLSRICNIVKNIEILNTDKDIMILDTQANHWHYEGCGCNIIK